MFPRMNSKLLTVTAVTLAAFSNLLVTAGESCGSTDKYWSSSTAQCENCASICVDTSRRSMECKIKCPDYYPAPIQAEVKGNPASSAAMPPYVLLSIGAAVTVFSIVVLVVGGLLSWKRRAVIKRYICRRQNDVEMQVFNTNVVSPTDDDVPLAAVLHVSDHDSSHPLIPNVIDSLTAQNIADESAHCKVHNDRRSNQY